MLFPYDELRCGSLSLSNGGVFTVYSGPSAMTSDAYGAYAKVDGCLTIASNSWIYLWSSPTNGGSALFRVGALSIAAGGGGYGGAGGPGVSGVGGGTYGISNAPVWPGSGGASGWDSRAGNGGGAVRIMADSRVTIDGLVSASGDNTLDHGGGGSGGSIWIECMTLTGATTGVVRANGGTGLCPANGSQYTGGGGGGGRIAFRAGYYRQLWTPTVAGALGSNTVYAGDGTIVLMFQPPSGSVFFVR